MTLNVSGRSFGEELAAYLTLLRDLPDMRDLSCTRVVVVENDFLSAEETEPPSFDVSARGARAFKPRFEQILASAARGWVNLTAKMRGEIDRLRPRWWRRPIRRRRRRAATRR